MHQENRILRRDRIEFLFIGEFLVGPQRVVPATAGDPLAFFVLRHGIGDALLQLFNAGDAVQPHGEHVRARVAEVHVGIIEAGHDEFAHELNGFGARIVSATFEQDEIDFANTTNFAIANGHGIGPRLFRVIGVNPAMQINDDVRLGLRRLAFCAQNKYSRAENSKGQCQPKYSKLVLRIFISFSPAPLPRFPAE